MGSGIAKASNVPEGDAVGRVPVIVSEGARRHRAWSPLAAGFLCSSEARVYEQTMAKFPDLADRDGDGIPDIVPVARLQHGATVRKKIVVNGTTYEDLNAMPPDVRQLYEKAMSAVSAGDPTVKRIVRFLGACMLGALLVWLLTRIH